MGSINKNESKYQYTARLMDEALLQLLEYKDYALITVTEICKKAGVNRSTFYLHYEGIPDLLRETLEVSLKAFNSSFSGRSAQNLHIQTTEKEKLLFVNREYLLPYLRFIQQNKRLYAVVIKNAVLFEVSAKYEIAMQNVIYPVLERFDVPEHERKYVAAYYISGTQAIVREWVKDGCRDDIDDVASLIMKCIPKFQTNEGQDE